MLCAATAFQDSAQTRISEDSCVRYSENGPEKVRATVIVAVTITENESVFHFHQIVEEVVRVIVVRRIERKQLVEVGQELLCTLLVSNYR